MTCRMNRHRLATWVACAATLSGAAAAAAPTDGPRPTTAVVDDTGTLDAEETAQLERLATGVRKSAQGDIVIVLIRTTAGQPPRTFATALFNRWAIGTAARNDGLLIFAAIEDRTAEIVLGEGVDSPAQVAASERIMGEIMIPEFKAGRPANAVRLAAAACTTEILGAGIARMDDPPAATGRDAFRSGDFPRARRLLEAELQARRAEPQPRRLEVAQTLQNLAVVELQLGGFASARRHATEALEIRVAELGDGHPDVATTLNNLGAIEHAAGDYAAAERHLRRAVEIRRGTLAPQDPAVAQALDNLGCLLTTLGRHADADETLRAALAIRTARGDDRIGLATTTNNLAALHLERCDPDAMKLAAQAATLADEAFPADHPARIVVLGNEARSRPRLADARAAFDRAITLAGRTDSLETPAYAQLLNKLVNYHILMQDPGPIESLAKQAVTVCKRVFGDRHPATAMALNNLGVMVFVAGDGPQAASLIRESRDINEAMLGPTHPAVAENLANLAQITRAAGDSEAAGRLWRQAEEIFARLGGEDDPRRVPIAALLGHGAAATGDTETAERYYRQALAIASKRLGTSHPSTAMALTSLGALYCRIDRAREAEPLLAEALQIAEQVYGPDHAYAALALTNLAAAVAAQGRLKEARETCDRAVRVHDTVFGRLHPRSIDCRLRLADILQQLDDLDGAKRLRDEAEADKARGDGSGGQPPKPGTNTTHTPRRPHCRA